MRSKIPCSISNHCDRQRRREFKKTNAMTNVYCAFYNSATAYALFLLLIDMHAEWWNHPCCAPLCSYAWMTFHRPHSNEWWVQTTWNIYIYHSHKPLEQYNYLHVRWINYSFYTLPFSMKAGNYIATFGEILMFELLCITIIHDIFPYSNLMILCEPKKYEQIALFQKELTRTSMGFSIYFFFCILCKFKKSCSTVTSIT